MDILGVYGESFFEVNRADWTPKEIPGTVPEFGSLRINKDAPGLILQKELRILRVDRRFTLAAWVDPLKKDGFFMKSPVCGGFYPSGLCRPLSFIFEWIELFL